MPYPGSLLQVKIPILSSVPEWQERRSLAVAPLVGLETREGRAEERKMLSVKQGGFCLSGAWPRRGHAACSGLL